MGFLYKLNNSLSFSASFISLILILIPNFAIHFLNHLLMKLLLLALIPIPLSLLIYLRMLPVDETIHYQNESSFELTSPGLLLSPQGALLENGWARKPIKTFNRESLPLFTYATRLKQWDYFHITTNNIYLAIAFVDLAYVQSVQFTYFSLASKKLIHKDALILMPHLKLGVEPYLRQNETISYQSADFLVRYRGDVRDGREHRFIQIQFSGFAAELEMQAHREDDLVTVKALSEDGSKFFYSRKAYNWDVQGQIQDEYLQQANAGMDWGRGVFNYNTFWLWISGMGNSNNNRIGFNLGAGNDGGKSGSSDEGIFVNNQLFKLQGLRYTYDLSDLEKNIIIEGQDLYIEFAPQATHLHEQDLLLVDVKFRQLLGTFKGRFREFDFEGIIGIVELNRAKW